MRSSDARSAALDILIATESGRHTLDRILEDRVGDASGLSKKDMALMHALVYGVLRWRNRLDWITAHYSRTPLSKINPKVLNAIRLGLFQMIYMDRVPVSAAVNTSVNLTKSIAAPWVVRFVNAILRNAARGYQQLSFPDPDGDFETAISVQKSFPRWLVKKWTARYGRETTEKLCDAINTIPPITVRVNTLLTSRRHLLDALAPHAEHVSPTRSSPDGIRFSSPDTPLFEMKPFLDGWFQVQDEAAQLISRFMGPLPGETVMDACAGLGGKTGHIGQLMHNNGRIVAMDKQSEKLNRLKSEMTRLGITNVSIATHDLDRPLSTRYSGRFDRILVDAPCSGLGVLRRNPDAKWSVTENRIQNNRDRQLRFLEALVPALKPFGTLVYTVCSLEPEENESVIKNFLYRHPSFAIVPPHQGLSENMRPLVDSEGYFRTNPLHHDMDGFFSVRLKRASAPTA